MSKEIGSGLFGPKLFELDKAVWEIRRYCRVIRESEVAAIEGDRSRPHSLHLAGGELEQILTKKDNPARPALIWQNYFFGTRHRAMVTVPSGFSAVNAPLTLNPELLEEVIKWVYLPDPVVKAYKEYAEERRIRSSSVSSPMPSESSTPAQPPPQSPS